MIATRKVSMLLIATTACLCAVTSAAVLRENSGEPAVPLDDAYIHFQYAQSIAQGRPLTYSPGDAPVSGATSLLWPALLAPFFAIGQNGSAIVWVAWLFGWVSLGLLAFETWRAASPLVSAPIAVAAAAMTLCFGGHVWFAGSGMEVVPLAWLLLRSARRAAEWAETPTLPPKRAELNALALLGPLLRPEGALASLIIAVTLFKFRRGRHLGWSFVPLSGLALPPLFNLAIAGQAMSTTAQVKWLVVNPYYDVLRLAQQIGRNVWLLFSTLLNGELWSSPFLPQGCGPIAWLALPALIYSSLLGKRRLLAGLLLVVALGIFIPTSYDSFLWNRLRYLWPFAAPWFIGLAITADRLGQLSGRYRPHFGWVGPIVAGALVLALATQLPHTIRDLAQSARAISQQQVALGRWARDHLPQDSVIGINDAGAITYFSKRRTFDIVGLTTQGEAPFWVAGAGSRFEHYERLGARALPTHFIVYPEWMALPPLLGSPLTERSVPGATILGGITMAAHVADYTALGSGALPEPLPLGSLLDELDVADLQSEAEHAYRLLDASQQNNFIAYTRGERRADGARGARVRDIFELAVRGAGALIMRVAATEPMSLRVRVSNRIIGTVRLTAAAWQEATLPLPADLPAARATLLVEAQAGKSFASMHYWSFGQR